MALLQKPVYDARSTASFIGVPERTVRSWVETERFLPGGKRDERRILFSVLDIAILASAARMIPFGVPVETAVSVSKAALDESPALKNALKSRRFDAPGIFTVQLADTYLRIFRVDGNWRWLAGSYNDPPPHTAYLTIAFGLALIDALHRAGLIGNGEGAR
jgi:hypothetical protein